MLDDVIAFLSQAEGPLAYAVLSLSAVVEVVVPPWPGDSLIAFGAFLSATSDYSPFWVYACSVAGSTAGGLLMHGFGGWVGARRERWPSFLRGPKATRALSTLLAGFHRHGAAYLAVNRFWPTMRFFFFIAAGMAGLSRWTVAVFGAVSAALWTGLIFAAGWAVGHNLDRMEELFHQYTLASAGFVVLVLGALALRWWWRRRQGAA